MGTVYAANHSLESLFYSQSESRIVKWTKGAESTRKIAPRLGRATYVGVTDGQERPPAPGAWAAAVVARGLKDGLEAAQGFA